MTKKFHPHLLSLVWPMFRDGRRRPVRKDGLADRKGELAEGEYERMIVQIEKEAAEYAALNKEERGG